MGQVRAGAADSLRHSCCAGLSASTAQHGWAALCSPTVRRAQQLPAKMGRAAIVTMTANLPVCPARKGDNAAPGTCWLSVMERLRNKKRGFVEGEIWAKLVVFNCKLQEAEGRVVDATCSDFSKTFDNCSNACCQINSEWLSCQHRHMDKTQAAQGMANSLAISRGATGAARPLGPFKTSSAGTGAVGGEEGSCRAVGTLGTEGAAVLPGEKQG